MKYRVKWFNVVLGIIKEMTFNVIYKKPDVCNEKAQKALGLGTED